MRALAVLVIATGCNAVFGLDQTKLLDAKIVDPNNPDAFRPIVPPDGTTSCSGPPSFEAWTYAPRSIPFGMQVGTYGLYAAGNATVLIVTPVDGSGIYEVDLSAGTRQIAGLVPPSGKMITSVAVSPEGAAIWFKIEDATYVALRANGFERQLTELGVPNAYEILPGQPGFHDGSLRMVVRLREAISSQTAYVELSSQDGVTWTRGATLPFGGPGYFGAALSADGCVLTLARMEGGSSYALYYAYRDAAGNFGALVKLTAATTAGGSFPINPALAPSGTSMWFQAGQGLFEGHP